MTSASRQELLFLTCKGPWSSAVPAACADLMMTAAVFDQSVSVVFCADGVYQLLKAQDGSALEQKTFAQMFPALDLYDIRKIYVVAAALSERGLTQDELLIRVELITDVQLQALVGASKAVYVF